MTNIVGFMGLAGSGKSRAAGALVAHGYVEVALADPMKRFAAEVFGWDATRLWGPTSMRNQIDPEAGCSARQFLQLIGTEAGRHCSRDVWVKYLLRTVRRLDAYSTYVPELGVIDNGVFSGLSHAGVVVPDVRFRNEAEAIRAAGGRVFRIVRHGAGLTGAAAAHASEAEQLGICDEELDGVIVNDGTIEQLHDKVIAIVTEARAA